MFKITDEFLALDQVDTQRVKDVCFEMWGLDYDSLTSGEQRLISIYVMNGGAKAMMFFIQQIQKRNIEL
jgi:hypothetical protein